MTPKTKAIVNLFSKNANISNGLSAIRLPLAILFLMNNVFVRLIVILLAMISDSIDGYIARKRNTTSKFGAILDPAMDKFFVYFTLTVLHSERVILFWQLVAMLSRDIALCVYGICITLIKGWKKIELRPIRWGKITTAMQFLTLLGLSWGYQFGNILYSSFMLIGGLVLIELLIREPHVFPSKNI